MHLLALLGLAAGLSPARAGVAPTADAAQSLRALQLETFINGKKTGLIGSFSQGGDGGVSAKKGELAELGVQAPGDAGPQTLIALDSIAGLSYRYDEPTQSIHLDVADSLLIGHDYPARASPSERPRLRKSYGAVLNYDLFSSANSRLAGFRPSYQGASATLDARLFSPYGALSQSGILGSTPLAGANALRLDTTASYSDEDGMRTYNVGDAISSGLAWTRPIRMAGAQAQRNFVLRPDLVTLPLPALSGNAAVPSTLDVYVNNVRTYSQDVAAGPYRVTDLPVVGGGTAHVVLHDASGKQIEQDLQFFASRLLIRPGLTDYSVEVGVPRRSYGVKSQDYAMTPVAVASLRRGVYDWLTLEAHGEGSPRLANAGAGAVARLFDRGVVSVAAEGSRSPHGAGLQLYGAFETQFRGVTMNVAAQRLLGSYDDLASTTAAPTPKLNGVSVANSGGLDSFAFLTQTRPPREVQRLSIGAPLPFDTSTIVLAVTRFVNADTPRTLFASANWSRPIVFDASLYVSLFSSIGTKRQYGVFAGLTMPLGPKTVASVGAGYGAGPTIVTADVSRTLEQEAGSYGWRLHDAEGGSRVGQRSAALSYRSSAARVEVGAGEQAGVATGTLDVNGAVATVGNGVFVANRIDDAFAVVDATAPDVAVYHDNRLIGRTDASGRLIVPYLRSYQKNEIRIDTTNLPVNADAKSTQEVVTPAYRNGVRVDFGVKPDVAGAIVILTDGAGAFIAAGTEGVVGETGEKFVVGYDGRAYVRGLGPHSALRVLRQAGECAVEVDYQPQSQKQVVIGPIACR